MRIMRIKNEKIASDVFVISYTADGSRHTPSLHKQQEVRETTQRIAVDGGSRKGNKNYNNK